MLRTILRAEEFKNAIIFCNKKTTVRDLYTSLKRSGFAVGQIHGDMEQSARIAELDRFKKDEINILVASDVAARGLDIKGVSHVINFDVPWQPDDYIHRIGRTGRAGATGTAYTLATRDDAEAVAAIEKLTGMKLPGAEGGKATKAIAEPKADPKPEKVEHREKADKPARGRSRRRGRSEPQPAAAEAEAPASPLEPRPADDASPNWNGPVPSFLQFGAA
jgi:superfamily II DNA/RNA helicase